MKWMEQLAPKIKKIGVGKLVVLVLAGILLVFLSIPSTGNKSSVGKSMQENNNDSLGTESLEEYRHKMEKKLSEVLTKVQGVGKTEVALTLQASREKVPLKDDEKDGEKLKQETVLTEQSDNSTSPYVLQEKEPLVEGVVIVCVGGDDENVRQEIIAAVQVLFNIETHKIRVMKMQS